MNAFAYNQKSQYLFELPYSENLQFTINVPFCVDKIRMSVAGNLERANPYNALIQVYNTMTNQVIGTLGYTFLYTTAGGADLYLDRIIPENGCEFFYRTKTNISGTYELFLRLPDGTIPQNINGGGDDFIYLMVEAFAY
jgi:hypothetical protein